MDCRVASAPRNDGSFAAGGRLGQMRLPWLLADRLLMSGAGGSITRAFRSRAATPGASGAVAQLGERLNGIQEVSGSIPLSSTTLLSTGCAASGAVVIDTATGAVRL